jgi:uncharacterized protein
MILLSGTAGRSFEPQLKLTQHPDPSQRTADQIGATICSYAIVGWGMDFTWDENKRLKTLENRGLDFKGARRFFDGRPHINQPTPRNDEDRWKTTAIFDGKFYTMVWVERDEARHIITMRRAHEQEIRKYRALFGG